MTHKVISQATSGPGAVSADHKLKDVEIALALQTVIKIIHVFFVSK